MKTWLSTGLLALFAAGAAGCSGHSIREGIWELTYDAALNRTPKKFLIKSRVQVRVEWAKDSDGEVAELIQLEKPMRKRPEGESAEGGGQEGNAPGADALENGAEEGKPAESSLEAEEGSTEEAGAPSPQAMANLEKGLKPMFADIPVRPDDREKIIQIVHTDDYWSLTLLGIIESPTRIRGNHFLARHRHIDHLSFEGRWIMRWLKAQ